MRCRFGPGQPLARAFRHEQTRTAIIQKTCQIQHVENAWNMNKSGGARLLEKISDSKNEKKSRNYYLSKLFKAGEGEVDPTVQDTYFEIFTALDMKYIHLDA